MRDWLIFALGLLALALVAMSAAESQARCYGGVCYPDSPPIIERAIDEATVPMPSVVVSRRVAHRPNATCNRNGTLQCRSRCYINRVVCGHRFRVLRRGR